MQILSPNYSNVNTPNHIENLQQQPLPTIPLPLRVSSRREFCCQGSRGTSSTSNPYPPSIDKVVKAQVWGTAGQEIFFSLFPIVTSLVVYLSYCCVLNFTFFVFDCSEKYFKRNIWFCGNMDRTEKWKKGINKLFLLLPNCHFWSFVTVLPLYTEIHLVAVFFFVCVR